MTRSSDEEYPVTREQALEIAREHLRRADPPLQGREIERVVSLEEPGSTRRPRIYGRRAPLDECWIAYVAESFLGPQPGIVILISRRSGSVVYAGRAYDEG